MEAEGEVTERAAVLTNARVVVIDAELTCAQAATQVPYYIPTCTGFKVHNTHVLRHLPHHLHSTRIGSTQSSGPTCPSMFGDMNRCDVMCKWPGLRQVDEATKIIRDVSDEELLQHCASCSDAQDPDGTFQVDSMRGAQQMGMDRQVFNHQVSIDSGQEARKVHASCYAILSDLIAKVVGDRHFAYMREPNERVTDYLLIDPVGVIMVAGVEGFLGKLVKSNQQAQAGNAPLGTPSPARCTSHTQCGKSTPPSTRACVLLSQKATSKTWPAEERERRTRKTVSANVAMLATGTIFNGDEFSLRMSTMRATLLCMSVAMTSPM